MKVKVNLPVSEKAKLLVDIGMMITKDTIISKIDSKTSEKFIHISKLLHVTPTKISSYMKKKIDEKIESGDILAEKKGLLKSLKVQSPTEGKIKEIDFKKGTITITSEKDTVDNLEYISPIAGKVVSIGKQHIEIEIDGEKLEVVKINGHDVIGRLRYFAEEEIDFLDVTQDIEKKIILCNSIKEDIIPKIEVLGAKAIISKRINEEISFPSVQVSDVVYQKLVEARNKEIWLRPQEKYIVILN